VQYSKGTVAVTYNSNVVWLNGTGVSWAGIKVGALFGVLGDSVFYPVGQYRPGSSGGRSSIVLTGTYRGSTNAAASYVISNDFTANLGLPMINRGDLETATIFDYAMSQIDSTWKSVPGDMFKSVYDPTNRGYVDHAVLADTVAWSGITNPPTAFAPTHHANTHLPGTSDPIALASPSAGGLCPQLDGVTITVQGGKLTAAGSATVAPHEATHHVGGSDPIGLASTTVEGLCPIIDGVSIQISGSKLIAPKTTPLAHAPTHLSGGTDPITLASAAAAGLCPTVDNVTIQVNNNKLTAVGAVPLPHAVTHLANGSDPVALASTTSDGMCPPVDGTTIVVQAGKLSSVVQGGGQITTFTGFTVPAINANVVVTVASATNIVPTAGYTLTDGTNFMNANCVSKAGLSVTFNNVGGGANSGTLANGVVFNGNTLSHALANTTQAGLLAQLSGAATDYVGGDNACHNLVAALLGFLVPTGAVIDFTGTAAPTGFLLAQGQAVSRATYGALYTALGGASSPWGQGDGSTTFNLPDLRSRVSVGAGQGTGLSNRNLADTGGEETHVLLVAELAAHTHTASQGTHNHTQNAHNHGDPGHIHGGGGGPAVAATGLASGSNWNVGTYNTASAGTGIQAATATNIAASAGAITIGSQGSGTAHNTMQPFVVLNKIIKNLKAGDPVGYQAAPGKDIVDGTVITNGPRVDGDGKPVPHMLDLLVIQLGAGPTQVSWEPENYPAGIPQLVTPEPV
jgi:microcystin-dependent protein